MSELSPDGESLAERPAEETLAWVGASLGAPCSRPTGCRMGDLRLAQCEDRFAAFTDRCRRELAT